MHDKYEFVYPPSCMHCVIRIFVFRVIFVIPNEAITPPVAAAAALLHHLSEELLPTADRHAARFDFVAFNMS